MPIFDVTVRRMRVWHIDGVEADNAEQAKDKGDEMADAEGGPDDDYACETTAREVSK
jgi:hypothetical protein